MELEADTCCWKAHGYQERVTGLLGWEHSLKNESIVASDKHLPGKKAAERLKALIEALGLQELTGRWVAADRTEPV